MFIKSLRLRGYKRFHDLTIDLGDDPGRIVALVGPNGCGKSSVFDGLLFLQNSHATLGGTGNLASEYHSLHRQTNYQSNNIEVTFTDGSYRDVRNRTKRVGTDKTIFSFRSPYRYNSQVKISETKSVDEIRLNNYGASTTSAIDAKMEVNYRRLQAKFSNYRDENDLRPSEAKTHIIGQLNTAIENCLELEIVDIGEIQTGKGTIYFKKPDQSIPFEFNVLSSGEKEVVDILLDLYLRKEDYTDTVFIIDEPELHINTAIQKKLLVEINGLVGENCQIWVATHSIGFLRALQEDLRDNCQIVHFTPSSDLATAPYTLYAMEPSRKSWLDIFETALDDLTHLVSPRRIVYCEGKAESKYGEERGVDAQVYNHVFSSLYHDTLFVSSGGNTEPEQRSKIALAILPKILNGVEILVLNDRDFASGVPTTSNDREVHLRNSPENHRILNRWELENYLYDSEVLKCYCKQNDLQFDEISYSKHVKDIVNDNVKDKTGIIKNICGIKGNINKDRFKIELSRVITTDMEVYNELHRSIFFYISEE